MKNQTKTTASNKSVSETVIANVSKSKTNNSNSSDKPKANASKIVDLNLSKYADKLKTVELKEKKSKDSIYLYPDEFTPALINSDKGKKFRNKIRNSITRFSNNIFVFAKTNQSDKLIAEINLFNEFYKMNFRITDYTVKSISQANNEKTIADIELMLEIVKDVNNAKK